MYKLSFFILIALMAISCKKQETKPAEVEGISIKTSPAKACYYIDEALDLSGLVVSLTMENGTTKDVAFADFGSNSLSCSPENGTQANSSSKLITITHTTSGKSANFEIIVDKLKDDRDGQIYKFVKIGNQVWMAENLRYKASTSSWIYNKDSINYFIPYGRHYTRETAMNGESSSNAVPSGIRGICPNGWHLPSSLEFQILDDYLGANELDGDDLKESGTAHWKISGGTNSTGFSAVGTGIVSNNGNTSIYLYEDTNFHTTTGNSSLITGWELFYDRESLIKTTNYSTDYPMCIRCLQD
jgi:uncharacterized protein (TIGR02145 family)